MPTTKGASLVALFLHSPGAGRQGVQAVFYRCTWGISTARARLRMRQRFTRSRHAGGSDGGGGAVACLQEALCGFSVTKVHLLELVDGLARDLAVEERVEVCCWWQRACTCALSGREVSRFQAARRKSRGAHRG